MYLESMNIGMSASLILHSLKLHVAMDFTVDLKHYWS